MTDTPKEPSIDIDVIEAAKWHIEQMAHVIRVLSRALLVVLALLGGVIARITFPEGNTALVAAAGGLVGYGAWHLIIWFATRGEQHYL